MTSMEEAFLQKIKAEILALEASIKVDPRSRRLDLLRKLAAEYEAVTPAAVGE